MSIEPTYTRNMLAATELAHKLRAALLPLAERTDAQLHELYRDTTADRAFLAAAAVHEVWVTLIRLGAELERRP